MRVTTFRIIAVAVLSVLMAPRVQAQGCSDAGVCTIGTVQAGFHADDSEYYDDRSPQPLRIQVQSVFGAGENGVTILQVVPEASWTIASPITTGTLAVKASLPYVYATGVLKGLSTSHSGIGDAMISVSNTMAVNASTEIGVTVGTRLPTGSTDASSTSGTAAGSPLPMPYQTGLGTTDLLLGASVSMDAWAVALGYQHVLQNGNSNAYVDDGEGYFTSKDLVRGNDAVARLTYTLSAWDVSITPSLLAIYRLQADRVEGAEVAGSRGLTLNAAIAGRYMLSRSVDLRVDLAMPLIIRDVRPDGLTRAFVAAVTIGVAL